MALGDYNYQNPLVVSLCQYPVYYRIFWPITHTVYNLHRHRNVNFLKNYYPHRQITCISHRTKTVHVTAILHASVLGTSHLLLRDHVIFICKMAARIILIAHFTYDINIILVYSTIIRLL